MLKRSLLAISLAFALAGSAFAYTVGTPPTQGPQLVDGTWLNGLAGGYNYSFQSGISAAGTTQATATPLPTGIYLLEIDTVPASSGVALPPCLPGTQLQIYNATGTTVTIYPAVANNPLTAAQDTINSATSITLLTHTATSPACAKAGNWYAS